MQISEQSVTWPFSTDLMQFIFSNMLFFFSFSDDGFKWESSFFGNCIEFYGSFVRRASFWSNLAIFARWGKISQLCNETSSKEEQNFYLAMSLCWVSCTGSFCKVPVRDWKRWSASRHLVGLVCVVRGGSGFALVSWCPAPTPCPAPQCLSIVAHWRQPPSVT